MGRSYGATGHLIDMRRLQRPNTYSLESKAGQPENSSWSWEGFLYIPMHKEGSGISGKSEKVKEVYELSKVTREHSSR